MPQPTLIRSAARPLTLVTKRRFHTTQRTREHFINADAAAFKKRALDESSSRPVLVDFFATWCQPCRLLSPVLERLTSPESGYDLLTIDVDEQSEVASDYQVSALPTVVAFKNGKPVSKFVGVLKEAQIKTFLEQL